MNHFRLLKRTRQVTDYSCGASALRSVLSYWGREVDEEELMKLMKTTFEAGTYPEDMVRGARAFGFQAEAKENLTIKDLTDFTADGKPVIVVLQAWRSQSSSPASVAEEWDAGHYIVVLEVDEKYVYFQDPFAPMSKAFVPHKLFEDHWHQVMGGDLKKNPKLIHLGIFVRGDKPAEPTAAERPNIASLKFGEMGSLNLIVTHFKGFLLPFDFLDELRDLWTSPFVRPKAYLFLRKDKNGNLSGMEGGALQDDADATAINALLAVIADHSVGGTASARTRVEAAIKAAAEGDFGLSIDDIERIAVKLPPDHSAIVGLFENIWERRFKEVASKHAGAVINQRLVTPEALATAVSAFAGADRPVPA
jgi:predicted double-glycine peptidase